MGGLSALTQEMIAKIIPVFLAILGMAVIGLYRE